MKLYSLVTLCAAVVLLVSSMPSQAGWFSKSYQEETQEAFTESVNKGRQRILEKYHLLAEAKEVKVQKLVLYNGQGQPTESKKDAVGFVVQFVIFWNSPARSDGFLKLNAVYDFSVENFVEMQVVATNGTLNQDAAQTIGNFLGELLGSPQ